MHRQSKENATLLTPAQSAAVPSLFTTFLKQFNRPETALISAKDSIANLWLRESLSEEELRVEISPAEIDEALLMLKGMYNMLRSLEQLAIDEQLAVTP